MRTFTLTLLAALGLAAAASADPIEGVWQTQVDDGSYAYVTIAPCGAAFCGTITRTFNTSGEYNSPNKGRQIVRNMAPTGGGNYAGNVWRPSNNKVYKGDARVTGNQMRLRGCIGVCTPLTSASQTWVKIE